MRKASQWLLMSCQIQTPVSLQGSVHRERTCSISSDSIYLDYTASKHYLSPRYFIKWYWRVWWSIFERLHFWSDKLQQASLVKFTFSTYTWSVFERAPIIPICRNLYYSKQTHNGTGVLAFIEIKTTEKKTGKLILSSFFLWPNERKVRVQIRAISTHLFSHYCHGFLCASTSFYRNILASNSAKQEPQIPLLPQAQALFWCIFLLFSVCIKPKN